ncbi:cytochrome c3 family protein [Sphingomonas bacterium]|uniref:cytochrome c3 family protein n=1 Tax=Sphingomonas bacterium TaxID=1895847 RepID=UPI001C2D01DB|nr:cytochrome c3 family protein [Sphingomonas bacterium]
MCHYGVETGARAIVPPTKVCMTCHSQLWTNAPMLGPVRESFATGRPLTWSRVNRLPDYAYFDHHVHVRGGVPCAACHGAMDDMALTRQAVPMTMQWCLSCHREPGRRIVPAAREYAPRPYDAPLTPAEARAIHARVAGLDTAKLTDCSTCHR